MSAKVYHGPPGSYKSSSAVHDVVRECARTGRLLITNVRGLSEARIVQNVKLDPWWWSLLRRKPTAVHADFKLLHLRMDSVDDLDKMRKWWHWAPVGAYFLFDEVQAIYPIDWGKKELHDLDMKEPRIVNGNELPKDVSLAFDMHRHGNWDFCYTTPNIKKVIAPIRAVAEIAYKHKNLGALGIRGWFYQFVHLAEDSGGKSDTYTHTLRRMPQWVFACYDSTTTGVVSDTVAGRPIWKNTRIMASLVGLLLCGLWLSARGGPSELRHKSAGTVDHPQGLPVAGLPALSQGVRDAGGVTGYSAMWRIVSLVEVDGDQIVYLASGRRVIRYSGDRCERKRWYYQCKVEDGVATNWTGPEPIVEQYVAPKDRTNTIVPTVVAGA